MLVHVHFLLIREPRNNSFIGQLKSNPHAVHSKTPHPSCIFRRPLGGYRMPVTRHNFQAGVGDKPQIIGHHAPWLVVALSAEK